MDLLFDCINGIPKSENLTGLYIIDGHTKYISTKREDIYRLYSIDSNKVQYHVCDFDNLNTIDSYISEYVQSLKSQTAINKKDTRIVYYVTANTDFANIKHPTTERTEINRYVSNRQKKLF